MDPVEDVTVPQHLHGPPREGKPELPLCERHPHSLLPAREVVIRRARVRGRAYLVVARNVDEDVVREAGPLPIVDGWLGWDAVGLCDRDLGAVVRVDDEYLGRVR